MKIIYTPRRGGKTTKAIRLCKKTGAILIVANAALRRQIIHQSPPRWTLPERQVVTFDEILHGPLDRLRGIRYATKTGYPEFILDDADWFLQHLVRDGHLRWVTMSKPFSKAQCLKYGIDPEGSRT